MLNDAKKVIKAYLSIHDYDRRQVREFIEKFEQELSSGKDELAKGIYESLGPLSSGVCPYCGK